MIPATFPVFPVEPQSNQNAAPDVWLGAAAQMQFPVSAEEQV
jgi:hypothetical protein